MGARGIDGGHRCRFQRYAYDDERSRARLRQRRMMTPLAAQEFHMRSGARRKAGRIPLTPPRRARGDDDASLRQRHAGRRRPRATHISLLRVIWAYKEAPLDGDARR